MKDSIQNIENFLWYDFPKVKRDTKILKLQINNL